MGIPKLSDVFRVVVVLCVLSVVACGGDDGSEVRKEPASVLVPVDPTTTSAVSVPSTTTPVVVPLVHSDPLFEVATSTHVYGQGLSSPEWGSPVEKPMDLWIDVYEPVDAPGNRPLMLFIHGGGFVGGSRVGSAGAELGEYLAERGFVAASVNYRSAKHHGTVPAD